MYLAGTELAVSDSAVRKARDFIANETQFHLGFLPTEQSNPITATLEDDFRRSTVAGVQCLQRADRQIPIAMRHVFAGTAYAKLVDSMAETVTASRGRVIFSGCGATGRLAILLESLWRDFFARRANELSAEERKLADRAASIMTGGDFALVKAVESFEDSVRGGERQAAALQVGVGDTFVAITEGGETSSVLGTLRQAVARGAKCFLVFNNPASILRARLERCREAIDNPQVTVIDLYCGSMGLAGKLFVSAAPYRNARESKGGGCQVDLLIQTRKTAHVVEMKRKREIGPDVCEEVARKVKRLPVLDGVSVRTCLVYDGSLATSVVADDFFDTLISACEMLAI